MKRTFANIVKSLLQQLPSNDYPVLNSRLFTQIWLTFVFDQSITSMRSLFYRLNKTGIKVDISTFSKACKTRLENHLIRLYSQLVAQIKCKNPAEARMLFPIDSTVVSLTSKLFWQYDYHQVKLMNGINITQRNTTECIIHFGQGHDSRFREMIHGMIPENAVGIMDRGFASWEFFDELSLMGTPFVVRIKNNMKTELDHYRYRIVWFCDLESRTEFRLATNLSDLTNEEVSEIYRHRWKIEILWKFLKMHLKLDKLITKSINGVTMQIYMILIGYLILELIEIPKFYGEEMLDKLRYLQLEIGHRYSIVHWSFDWFPGTLVGRASSRM